MAQILVVDDEPAVRDALTAHLRAMGHETEEAGNGLEALECLHRREYDIIVTDVAMPKMNGLQFLDRALPHLEDRVPIVLLSSVDDRTAVSAAFGAGAFDYLAKPAELTDVRRVIEESLARRAEVLRIHGRRRASGGPIPADALGEQARDTDEAPITQMPAGVPAFRTRHESVSIPPPADTQAAAPQTPRTSLFSRLRRLFGRSAA